MYTDYQIENIFDGYIKNQEWFKRYVEIYKFYKEHSTANKKYNFHHFYPVNYTKEIYEKKNRRFSVELHDSIYNIEDNIVKLTISYHIIAHYCLAKATERKDDINSFLTLIGDYSYPIEYYSLDYVKELAKLVEENSQESVFDHYLTFKERKEKYKEFQDQNKKQWEENHKEEIEERKRKQKEYRKEIYQKQKEYLKKNDIRNKKK